MSPASTLAQCNRRSSCRKVGRKVALSAQTSRLTAWECSPNLRRSDRRHPKCHCSWNTIKCFCSCCCPLKIRAASMTAAEISQALPFTCQQALKIVRVASTGHCLLLAAYCEPLHQSRFTGNIKLPSLFFFIIFDCKCSSFKKLAC